VVACVDNAFCLGPAQLCGPDCGPEDSLSATSGVAEWVKEAHDSVPVLLIDSLIGQLLDAFPLIAQVTVLAGIALVVFLVLLLHERLKVGAPTLGLLPQRPAKRDSDETEYAREAP
jgi:hypothetical protein